MRDKFRREYGRSDRDRSVLPDQSKKIDTASLVVNFLGSISQMATLVVVAVGYFYTVLPVFQKELMAEQNAELILEKRRLDAEISAAREELGHLVLHVNELRGSREALSSRIEELVSESHEAKELLSYYEKEIHEVSLELDGLSSKYYGFVKRMLVGEAVLPAAFISALNSSIGASPFSMGSHDALLDRMHDSYVQPIDIAQVQLKELVQIAGSEKDPYASGIHSKVVLEYKKGMEANSKNLVCPEPDYELWKKSYVSAIELADSYADECSMHLFSLQKAENGWSDRHFQRLRSSNFWREQDATNKASCRASFRVHMSMLFNKAWASMKEPCRSRIYSVNKVVLGEYEAPSFGNMEPPRMDDVKKEIQSVMERW